MKKSPSTLASVVSILNSGIYHDGTSIGQKLHITRSAVWKAIQKLVSYGIEVDSIKGKGYSLTEPLILLNEDEIQRRLNDQNLEVEVIEQLDSTNGYLKTAIGIKKPKVCIAELQIRGRGRLNRSWHSPFAQNIYLSCIYPFYKDSSELAGLTLVISLAIVNALKQFNFGENLCVKWPNDIIYKDKKLAGSLIEIQSEANGISYAIIGIGLNVNMQEDRNKSISQKWTSIRKILNTYINRNHLSADLINNIISYLEKFDKEGFTPFIKEWERVDILYGKKITLNNINNISSGYARGINNQGNLLLELEDGAIKIFSSGDTTIAKHHRSED